MSVECRPTTSWGDSPRGFGASAPLQGEENAPICLKSGQRHGLFRWRDSCSDCARPMRTKAGFNVTALGLFLSVTLGYGLVAGCGGDDKEETGAGVSAIVFVKRQHTTIGSGAPEVNVA